jgi:hypothetical protein
MMRWLAAIFTDCVCFGVGCWWCVLAPDEDDR